MLLPAKNHGLQKIRWIAEHLEEMLGALLLGSMACLAFANVITRYLLDYSLAYTEELEVNGMVWLTLFGAAAAFRRKRHLRLTFLQEKLAVPVQRWLNLGIGFLAVGLFVCLGYLGYMQLLDERLLEITSESLGIPQWIYTVSIPIGCVLVVYRIFEAMITDIKKSD